MLSRARGQLLLTLVLVVLRLRMVMDRAVWASPEALQLALDPPLPAYDRPSVLALQVPVRAALVVVVPVTKWLTRRVWLVPSPALWARRVAFLAVELVKGRAARVRFATEKLVRAPDVLLKCRVAPLLALLVLAVLVRRVVLQSTAAMLQVI